MYPQSIYVLSKDKKNIKTVLLKIFNFYNLKNLCILHGHVFVMNQAIDFSNTQGQITPQSDVGSSRNSKSSEMLWVSLKLPRIKKNRIKMKALA